MIRAGFIINFSGRGWLGGINYFRNLFTALDLLEEQRIWPVIIAGKNFDPASLKDYPPVEIIRTSMLDRWRPAWLLRNLLKRIAGRDVMLERLLRKKEISLLSHSACLGRKSKIPSIAWIADFQHLHLPEMFTREELDSRNKQFSTLCRDCDCVLVSSRDALKDLDSFSPECASKAKVLHFVGGPINDKPHTPGDELREKYSLSGPFFHLPNHFWAHKNHRVVIEGLGRLKQSGTPVQVVCTGETVDYRRPDFFASIESLVKEYGLSEEFKVLGVIDYADVVGLMRSCLALINPSRFEGWSTTVEEAKTLGKPILLSDIPIHREQAPEGGIYFDPNDPEGLAREMRQLLDRVRAGEDLDQGLSARAAERLPGRREAFALAYEDIVLEIMSLKN